MLQESSQSKARSEVTVLLQPEIKKMIRYYTSKRGFIKHPRISPPFFVLAYLDTFFKNVVFHYTNMSLLSLHVQCIYD